MGKKVVVPPQRAPSRKQMQSALEDIDMYVLPVFTIERDGKEEQMVPLENAMYIRSRAREGLGVFEPTPDVETPPPSPAPVGPVAVEATATTTAVKKPSTMKLTNNNKKKGHPRKR